MSPPSIAGKAWGSGLLRLPLRRREEGGALGHLARFVDRVWFRWSGNGALVVAASAFDNNLPRLQPHLAVVFAGGEEPVGVVSRRSSGSVEFRFLGDVVQAVEAALLWFLVLQPRPRCGGASSGTIGRFVRALCSGASPRFGVRFSSSSPKVTEVVDKERRRSGMTACVPVQGGGMQEGGSVAGFPELLG